MEPQHERLRIIAVHFRSDVSLIIPVRTGDGEGDAKHAPGLWRRAALTPAQGEALYRHAMTFPEIADQIRALAKGEVCGTDLGDDEDAMPGHREGNATISHGHDVHCTGGSAYW